MAQPDEQALAKATSQVERVLLFPFASGVATWRQLVGPKVSGLQSLSVMQISHSAVEQLAHSVDRRLTAQVVAIEHEVAMTVGGVDVTFNPEPLM